RVRGGRFRLVVPTAAGLTWALRRLEAAAAGSQEERLLRTMLRADHMSPLVLPPGRIPSFLPHLREVNRVLVGALLAPALRVVWASSWPRPFPTARGLRLPAPDGVLVLAPLHGPRQLVLLEHDRATESLRSFVRTKVDRYRLLASRPGALEELTGHCSFCVLVTVGGDATAVPDRLRALRRVVRESFAERLIRVVDAREALEEPSRAFLDEGRGVPAAAQFEAMSPQSP
ncbi:MAG: replication-relaxation family protein, partial [Thermoanaerobaculia bacterium]|nr:replication-relaxation family protein [Thermoanaerobaculia bacterium]